MNNHYLFKSERLGFRNWHNSDLEELASLNADTSVMEYFPKTLTKKESAALMLRFQKHFKKRGYTYFATQNLKTKTLIGFIGLAYQEYQTVFNPAIDIGWRLNKSFWGKGYATEGAKRCLKYAFDDLKLERIISTCTLGNTKSEKVMTKIGMLKKGVFKHPKLKQYPTYENCVWYEIQKKA